MVVKAADPDDRWEPISATRFMWGVFDVEQPYEATPLALFRDRDDAEAWVAQKRQAEDEDERLTEYHQVFAVDRVRGRFWNSYDSEPEEVG